MVILIMLCLLFYLLGGWCCITLCAWASDSQGEEFTRMEAIVNFIIWPLVTIQNFFLTVTTKEPDK